MHKPYYTTGWGASGTHRQQPAGTYWYQSSTVHCIQDYQGSNNRPTPNIVVRKAVVVMVMVVSPSYPIPPLSPLLALVTPSMEQHVSMTAMIGPSLRLRPRPRPLSRSRPMKNSKPFVFLFFSCVFV